MTTYWRMQLHPNRSDQAARYTVQSLAAGYIGLDFKPDVGDLMELDKSDLPEGQRAYWAFAHEMLANDLVLIVAHNYPFALATVAGRYE